MKLPEHFLIGAATAAHQVEGNNIHSDLWAMEHMKHTSFSEPSLDAVDHYQYCTAIPIGTALAQSFDPAFVNLFMPGNEGDYDNLLQGIDSGAVTLEQVKINASRVVKMARALTQE